MAATEENILDDILHQNHEDDNLFEDEADKKTGKQDEKREDHEKEDQGHSDISTDDDDDQEHAPSSPGSISDEEIDEDRKIADEALTKAGGATIKSENEASTKITDSIDKDKKIDTFTTNNKHYFVCFDYSKSK